MKTNTCLIYDKVTFKIIDTFTHFHKDVMDTIKNNATYSWVSTKRSNIEDIELLDGEKNELFANINEANNTDYKYS